VPAVGEEEVWHALDTSPARRRRLAVAGEEGGGNSWSRVTDWRGWIEKSRTGLIVSRGGQNRPCENTEAPYTPESGPERWSGVHNGIVQTLQNSNGSGAVTRIVMAWFKFGRIVMAPI
jgi:hypothetical protein